ncbi:hypothetical protein HG530_000481 [Fusarium avenaceum]|nr:hypothetical protein HG530_000481 [Fusarium avenaceum]
MRVARGRVADENGWEITEPESIAREAGIIEVGQLLQQNRHSVEEVCILPGLLQRCNFIARSTTTHGTEKISVLAMVDGNSSAISKHHLRLKNLIGTETIVSRGGTMATSGCITTNGTGSFHEIDTVLELMEPQFEATVAVRATEKIMACSGNHKAKVPLTGIGDCSRDVCPFGSIYGVDRQRSKTAGGGFLLSSVVNWSACDVVWIRPPNRVRGLKVLIRPHLIDISALFQVLCRTGVTRLRNRLGLDEIAPNLLVEGLPL